MTDAAAATPEPLPGLITRAIGVVFSPKATFQKIVQTPKVAGAMALVTGISIVLALGFFSSSRGRDAFFDSLYDRLQRSNATAQVQAQQQQGIEQFEKLASDRPALFIFLMTGSNFIFLPVSMLVIGAVMFAVFNALMGGTATFKQVMAVVAHSSVMLTLQQLVTTPLNFARGTLTSATNLSVLLPMFDETSVIGRFLGVIDLFMIWSVIVLAIGLGVLYRRSGRAIAMTLLVLYGVVALGLALLRR